jgi:hypothetical protein
MTKFLSLLKQYFLTDPNSAKGLKIRAQRLIDKGFPKNNPMVTSLLKQAKIKEEEEA